MIKREELSNPANCMSRAHEDEMTFVLLGRDPAAPTAIRNWAGERVGRGKNQWDDEQILEALRCADAMEFGGRPSGLDLPAAVKTEQPKWLCFHCGFGTSDEKEAHTHFGDRDDASEFTPTCLWWARMSKEERVAEFQTLLGELNGERDETANQAQRIRELEVELASLRLLLDTPEVDDFDKAIPLEAAHQMMRWSAEQDAGKTPSDWFWLVGYLAGKGLAAHLAGDLHKAKHHCISSAAVLRNWHAHIRSGASVMRPGISAEKTAGVSNG